MNGNLLGWAGGRALFRTVNFSEIPRVIGIRDCDLGEGDLNAFDPRFPGKRILTLLQKHRAEVLCLQQAIS